MKKVILEMEDQKHSYEQKAKESLQKVLEEKMSAEQQLQSTQRSLALAEQKCEEWRSQYEALKEDWRTLGTQHRELESQLHVLQSKLQGADSRDLQMNQALRLLENEHQSCRPRLRACRGTETCAARTPSTYKVPFPLGPVAEACPSGGRKLGGKALAFHLFDFITSFYLEEKARLL
uniref:TRAF3 interacting protein 3 n=1 Tax=Sus scrofa TaxID=9823 RepID=A0A4X1THJ7_PIG